MRRERLLELAEQAGFTRIETCCPGVPNKVCSNDIWKGDISSFVYAIEQEIKADLTSSTGNSTGEPE